MDSATSTPMPRLRLTPDEGRRSAVLHGHLSGLVAMHGSVELRWYAPRADDLQTPHDRDEIYMVVSGTAVIMRAEHGAPFADDQALSIAAEERVAVQPGDVVFIPAGTVHRFEAMSPDFGTWMLFYGPEGGETA